MRLKTSSKKLLNLLLLIFLSKSIVLAHVPSPEKSLRFRLSCFPSASGGQIFSDKDKKNFCIHLLHAGLSAKSREVGTSAAGDVFILAKGREKSFYFFSDTVKKDTLKVAGDTVVTRKNENALESKVEYSARDSMRFDIDEQKMYLFGKAQVKYEGTTLKANYIELGMKDNIMYASGTDSAGKKVGLPEFDDNGQHFTAAEMKYNFKTKKGKIIKAITQQGEGYIHGESIKKSDENIMYIKNGKYTTCNNPDPHFHIRATKLKVIKDDKIITGPAYLMVEDAPTPLVVPFGMFPNNKDRSNGLVIPTYGQSPSLGFFLNDGGYYLGISDYMDAKILADIYSHGSWGGKVISSYLKNYKFSGNFNIQYSQFLQGEKDFPDFQKSSNFFIKWKHTQDPKANPTGSFSADVSAGTTNNFRKNINTPVNDYLSNVFQSSVNYQKMFSILKIPSNLALTASHNQNTSDSSITVTFPQVAFNVNRFYPLKRKVRVGGVKWYENIGLSYQSSITNTINTKQYYLFPKIMQQRIGEKVISADSVPKFSLLDSLKNGMSHTIPISTSIKMLKYLTLNPQFNYTEKWFLNTTGKRWDKDTVKKTFREFTDTIPGFARFGEWNVSASFTTTVYGMYSFRSKAIQAIRHQVVPSVGFSYKPDFSDLKYDYYREYTKPGITHSDTAIKYSRFRNDVPGISGPSKGKSGSLNFSLVNNLEMKVRSKKDTLSGTKKIKLLENLTFSSSYNFLADSMKLAPIRIAGRTNLFNALNLNFGGTFNPYKINLWTKNRVDTLAWVNTPDWWNKSRSLGTFTDGSIALSLNLKGGQKSATANQPKTSKYGTAAELADINKNIQGYVDFNVPWTLNVSYNIAFQKPAFNATITNSLTFNGDVRLTKNWKIGYSSGYDFVLKDFTFTSIDVYRDLHCWEMKLNVIPFGQRQSYRLDINVKSAVLQDLKLTKRKQWFDN